MNYPERYLNWQCLQMNRNQLPHPISHSEINQSLYHLPSSGLIDDILYDIVYVLKHMKKTNYIDI